MVGIAVALADCVERDCRRCRQLWEQYFAATVDEFAWRDRLAAVLRDHGLGATGLNIVVKLAEKRTLAARERIAQLEWVAAPLANGKDGENVTLFG